ncbi:helix-turn-helix domain-containing protein [Luteipulveratus halotolerans]|uniref:HTH cro/C1-type domain-containing protein n=1 Tax=Luteipulveratus halotolerans TaxID=1631356 RepID=A0A0L6CM18_9MICO|nr:hypothetical protein [Luteipulveratus halotolerans]KNX38680.1 hypothetical protein VV01_18455 [Luteipulveratus halotolerans]
MTQNPLSTMRGFSQAVDAAYARAGLADDIALAVRGHRRELGLSQRAHAEHRGCSRSLVARAEAGRSEEMTKKEVPAWTYRRPPEPREPHPPGPDATPPGESAAPSAPGQVWPDRRTVQE